MKLTDQGDLDIKYDKGGQKTVKNGVLAPELQKIKEELEKNGNKKLTKKELEWQLTKLEKQRKQLEQGEKEPKRSGLGLKIGIGVLVGIVLVGLVVILVRRNNCCHLFLCFANLPFD